MGFACQVLAPIVDGMLPFDVDTAAVLQDTLSVLASKEIKLTSLKTRGADDTETEQDAAQAVMAHAKKPSSHRYDEGMWFYC